MNQKESPINHIIALDGLRGIAVMLVVLHHFGVPARFDMTWSGVFGKEIHRLLNSMWIGVDLFFVISGFLITSILFKSRFGKNYFRAFFARRALRILPLHLGILALGVLTLPVLLPPFDKLGGESLRNIHWLVFYSSNIAMAFGVVKTFGVYDTLWSLAIEEQFYIFWPFVVKIVAARKAIMICVVTILLMPLARFVWLRMDLGYWGAYRFTLTRLDGLAIGAAIALSYAQNDQLWDRLKRFSILALLLSSGGLLLICASVSSFYPDSKVVLIFSHSLVSIAFGAVLVLILRSAGMGMAALRFRPLVHVGIYSYGIYIFHWPLLMIQTACGASCMFGATTSLQGSIIFLFLGITASVVLGMTSYHVFEKWFLRLRARIPY